MYLPAENGGHVEFKAYNLLSYNEKGNYTISAEGMCSVLVTWNVRKRRVSFTEGSDSFFSFSLQVTHFSEGLRESGLARAGTHRAVIGQ